MQKMIIAVRLINRRENSVNFQDVVAKYGDIIKLRIGMSDEPNHGLIMLYTEAEKSDTEELIRELKTVEGMSMNIMEAPR
ncbi:MAG TPA: hypothetical protein DCP90_01710 [Clostridiales bacterium]|nr:MAG: hypothetical protein A2Y22_01875 [Clostridiales bacterium GWD2_32_59]HAN09310.1 hypothetical protein [Clostridiales bacterium]